MATRGDNEGMVPEFEMPPALGPGMPLLALDQQPQFDVDAFLCSRAVGQDAPSILKELRAYKQTLQDDLVQMIKEKYRDFVSLSEMIKSESKPFEKLTDQVSWVHVQEVLSELRSRMARAQIDVETLIEEQRHDNEKRSVLKLLLELERAVLRLEVLVGIRPDMYEPLLNRATLCQWAKIDDEDDDTQLDAPDYSDDSVYAYTLYQRVYHEHQSYTWIQMLLSRPWPTLAKPFLMDIKPRLGHIYEKLCKDTLSLFSDMEEDMIATLTSSGGLSDDRMSQFKLVLDISIELGEACATEVLHRIRSSFISPLIQACFDAPDPIHEELDESVYSNTTELAQIRDLTHLNDWESISPVTTNPLRLLYNALLCAADRLSFVCQVAERVGGELLDIFNDILWTEMVTSLMERHGSHLFFEGKPNEFHKNYVLTQEWLKRMYNKAPSKRAAQAFKKNEATLTLERRWQLSAFFHMRTRDMVGVLDHALRFPKDRASDFFHPAFAHLLHAYVEPWTTTRHVPSLRAREWRLTLHVLSRYRTWLSQQLPVKPTEESDSMPPTQNATVGMGLPEEELRMLNSACGLLVDVPLFENRVRAVADSIIFPKLLATISERDDEGADALRGALKNAMEESLGAWTVAEPAVTDLLLSVLKRRCAEPLRHVRAANSQYRPFSHATKENISPSTFISCIVQPLEQLLGTSSDTPFRCLPRVITQTIVQQALDSTFLRYASAVDTVTRNLESLRRLKRGTMGLSSEEIGADDHVYSQLQADVGALETSVQSLTRSSGIEIDLGSSAWQSLRKAVERNP